MDNFPNLAREIDFQEVQEAQKVPKSLDLRKHTPRHIIITLPKIKQKERILEAAREKNTVTYKGVPIRLSADLFGEIKPKQKKGAHTFFYTIFHHTFSIFRYVEIKYANAIVI